VGFCAVDEVAQVLNIKISKPFFQSRYLLGKGRHKGKEIYLVKPLTFMNRSGEIIKPVLKKTRGTLQNLVIVYDNMDLPPGGCKLKNQHSTAGHNGLESVFLHVKSATLLCIAIGIGRPRYKSQVVNYVLSDPTPEETPLIRTAVQKAADAILLLLREPPQKVMNVLNQKS
jgi:PTH1 family peptidyl-tRNA hydrolase